MNPKYFEKGQLVKIRTKFLLLEDEDDYAQFALGIIIRKIDSPEEETYFRKQEVPYKVYVQKRFGFEHFCGVIYHHEMELIQ